MVLPGGGSGDSRADASAPDTSDASDAPIVPLHIVRTWEQDERLSAWNEAQMAAERDPDAAAYLLTCLEASEDLAQGQPPTSSAATSSPATQAAALAVREGRAPLALRRRGGGSGGGGKPFDPMRLLARLSKFYGWSDADMQRMPWRRLLGYAREADIMTEEENARTDDMLKRDGSGNGVQARARAYRDLSPDEVIRTFKA